MLAGADWWTGPSHLALLDNDVLVASWSHPQLQQRPTFAFNVAPVIYYPNDRAVQEP